jgi:hypothetical protein
MPPVAKRASAALAPHHARRSVSEPLGPHAVVAEDRQRIPVLAEKPTRDTARVQPHDRLEVPPAQMHAHELHQPVRDGGRLGTEGFVDLAPFVGRDGELEVPAGIVAPGAPAQGDAMGRESEFAGVEIDGLEGVLHGGLDPANRRQLLQRGERRRLRDVVLALNLEFVVRGHG